jgi:hypothetical protein
MRNQDMQGKSFVEALTEKAKDRLDIIKEKASGFNKKAEFRE